VVVKVVVKVVKAVAEVRVARILNKPRSKLENEMNSNKN